MANVKILKGLFLAIGLVLLLENRVEPAKTGFFFVFSIETFSEEFKFESLSAIFINKEELYVADKGGRRIYVFDLDGTPIFQFGKEKGLGKPIDLFVFEDRLYVAQESKNFIQIFNIRGDKIEKIAPPFEGFVPGKMALMEGGGFFVVDNRTHKICAFDKGGKYLYNFGGRDVFRSMGGIAVKDEKIFVTVMDSHPLIRIFDTKGKYLTGFGQIGDSKEFFSMPAGIKVDDQGFIWVVDAFKHRVRAYNLKGKLQAGFGGLGAFPGALYYPQNIEFKDDLFFVMEKEKKRISVFKRE